MAAGNVDEVVGIGDVAGIGMVAAVLQQDCPATSVSTKGEVAFVVVVAVVIADMPRWSHEATADRMDSWSSYDEKARGVS